MAPSNINIFVKSFPGLQVPQNLTLHLPSTASISDLGLALEQRLPSKSLDSLILTTTSNKQFSPDSSRSIQTLLSSENDDFLTIRLSAPLCGGKGGFGSQLRAAGGRMSSRRKKDANESNGSSRNLDGRRLRTVREAKALADYLALKPEMDKKEREERKKRLEAVLEMADKREEALKNPAKKRLDGKWVEEKEEMSERTREAVLAAIQRGDYTDNNLLGTSSGSSSSAAEKSGSPSSEDNGEGSSTATTPPTTAARASKPAGRTFFGFDEDDEFMSDSDDEEEDKDQVMADEKAIPVVETIVEEAEEPEAEPAAEAEEEEPEVAKTKAKGKRAAKASAGVKKAPARARAKGKGKA
jgi:hypothetical protein